MNQEEIDLVKAIAAQYAKYGAPFDDLVQEGMLGVLEARKRFDPDRGVKFTTYAAFWVKKMILQFLDSEMQYRSKNVELNEDILPDHEAQPETASTPAHEDDQALSLPDDMPKIEQTVLRMLYEQHKPLSEIAGEMNLRREKVRQLKQKALRRLRYKLPDLDD